MKSLKVVSKQRSAHQDGLKAIRAQTRNLKGDVSEDNNCENTLQETLLEKLSKKSIVGSKGSLRGPTVKRSVTDMSGSHSVVKTKAIIPNKSTQLKNYRNQIPVSRKKSTQSTKGNFKNNTIPLK